MAPERARRSHRLTRGVTVLLTAALVAGLAPKAAVAEDTPVAVGQAKVHDALFAAHLQMKDRTANRIGDLVLSAELLEWRRLNPSATAQQATDRLAARRNVLRAGLSAQDRGLPEPDLAVRVVGVLLKAPPSNVAASPHVQQLLHSTLGGEVDTLDTRETVANGALRALHWLRTYTPREAAAWAAVRRKAAGDAALAQAWNTVVGAPVGVDIKASFATLKDDPALRAFVDVHSILALRGSRSAFLAEGRRQFGVIGGLLMNESTQARARLVAHEKKCAAKTDTTCTPEQRAAAAETAKAEQKEIDTIAAAGKLIATILGAADGKEGERIGKVVTAMSTFITAINTYVEAFRTDALFSAATLTMTGNVIGAIMVIVGLFGDSGPSLDQQILEQVKKLREEVRAMHNEMRQRFARIEVQLNLIYNAMLTEFAKLSNAIAGNTAQLINIQNELARQGLRAEEIAASILTAIGDAQLDATEADINRYIGYEETFGEKIPTFDEYKDPENQFHFAATGVSKDGAFVVPASQANDPSVDPAVVLDVHGEAKAIGYMARLAHSRDANVPDPTQTIPNPGVWNLAARAYAALQLENPAFARRVSASRSAEIASQGRQILDTASSFSRPAAPDAAGNRTNALFRSLVADYRAAVSVFSQELSNIRTREVVVRDEPNGVVPVAKSYALFGATDQAVAAALPADPSTITRCTPSSSNPSIARPSNGTVQSLPAELRFAHYAFSPTMLETDQLPQVHVADTVEPRNNVAPVCYDAVFVNVREDETAFSIDEYARLRLSVRTRFRFNPKEAFRFPKTATYTWPEERISRSCTTFRCPGDEFKTESQALLAKWPRDKGIFEQSAVTTTDTGLVTEARTKMTQFLQGRQKALYDLVLTAARSAGAPLNSAVRRMNASARLLQAYTRVGFPVALETDDVLSAMLFGRFQIPVDTNTSPIVSNTYAVAFNRYPCPAAPGQSTYRIGEPCAAGPYNPMAGQPHFDAPCSVSGVPGLPGDPVGNCLVASAVKRLDTLSARYVHHSARIASGAHIERLPFVASTVDALPVVDRLVRTTPSS